MLSVRDDIFRRIAPNEVADFAEPASGVRRLPFSVIWISSYLPTHREEEQQYQSINYTMHARRQKSVRVSVACEPCRKGKRKVGFIHMSGRTVG